MIEIQRCALVVACSAATLFAAPPTPEFPEGAPTPRSMTKAEAAWVESNPITASPARGTGAPTGPVRCVAEYEPMDGIMIAYEGSSGWLLILRQMAEQITTVGNANVYVMCDTSGEASSVQSAMAAQGVNMDRLFTYVTPTNTIWMRDYGPRYIFEGGVRAIVDHTYNRPRPQDNLIPDFWAGVRGEPEYQIPLVHGGGNYHLDALGESVSTRLINNENPGLSESEIIGLWRDYQNLETAMYEPFPTNVDATQHIDMWMQVAGDDKVVISDWPTAQGSIQDQICEQAAADFAARGFEVIRVPAIVSGGTHFTFTNVVMCNDLILVPEYDLISASYSADAVAIWRDAFPDKTVVQIDCDSIVTAAGVMHCIVMHVPASSDGENPVVWVSSPNDGPTWDPGSLVGVTWNSDDDQKDVVSVDIQLSSDGGASFTTLESGYTDSGTYGFLVPDVGTTQGVLRVVAMDGDGNTGFDETDLPITITGTGGPCNGADLAEPFGSLDFSDVAAFLGAFAAEDASADLAAPFGSFDFSDVAAFLGLFGTGCP